MRLPRPFLLCATVLMPLLGWTLSFVHADPRAESPGQQSADPFLSRLPGSWKGEQQAGGVTLLETVLWQPVLRDQYLQCRLEASDPITGSVTYEGIGFLRHVKDADEYTFHWFDSNGGSERYRGAQSGDTLELESEGSSPIRRLTFRSDGDGYACTASRTTEGGSDVQVFESRYRISGKKSRE
ncbi:MAG: hypothetical protein V2A76_17350 [Planctomycetota bacterium]